MLNRIIQFSVRNKLIVALFTLALIIFGIIEVTKLPIDAVPDITNNQVQIITVSPSLGAPDVERLITFPIEQANSNIPGIQEIRSFSRFGLSLVTIVFDDNTDVYWARQQVTERLQSVATEIPKGAGTPVLGPVTTGLGEIYQYVLKPKPGFEKKYGPMELRSIQDWIVRRQLLGVKGVADVSSFGGLLKQYEIAVDPDKLSANNVTISEVFTALEANNGNTGGAYIEKGPTLLFIRSEGLIGNSDDLENIAVKSNPSGVPVMLRDVAEIHMGHATRYGTMVYNDEMEVAGAVVMMLKGGNSNDVIENVKDKIVQIQKTLPEGVVIEAFLDRTKMVNHAIDTVKTNLMEGALIVVFILVLFLGNIRAGLLVASVIPLAMLFAIILMNVFGVSGNLMSLGALDFGLIIDGAVIIVEAILHFLVHSKKQENHARLSTGEMDQVVEKTAGRMMNSAVFGQIIILVVYLPVFALSGIEGKMFMPMAQTVTFALIGAFVLSLTYVPMMSAWLLKNSGGGKKTLSDKMMEIIERKYQHALEKALHYKKWIIGTALGLFFISILVISQMGGEFIPVLEEGDFAVETRVMTGSNLQTSIAVSKEAAKILKSNFPEVIKVVAKIGSGEIPTDPMPIEAQDLMIILKDKSEWKSAKSFDELAEKMSKKLEAIPGASFGFQYPVQMRFNELMTGARQDVVCKIFGENLDSLASSAAALGKIAESVEGVADIYVEPIAGLPQIVIDYKRGDLARYGVSIAQVNEVVNAAFAGQVAGKVFEGEKRFDLVVRLAPNQRLNSQDVSDLLIPIANGSQIPLSQLADVSIKVGPNQIQREDAKRRIVVGFNVRGRDVQSIVEELQTKVGKQLKLPTGYFITYGGAFENLQAARKRLAISVPVSLALIFLLLFFAFGNIKDGLLIYSAIPLSTIGGILALAARGMPFSISAGVGFIALFGVAVLNGIVLIAEFRRLKSEGWTDVRKLVLHGTKIRLRPVLMTAAVASLGFLPMALSHGAGAEVQRPLATVVIGGLISATFLTLFVLPVIYIMFNSNIKKPVSTVVKIGLLLCLFSSGSLQAQQPISLQAAIDTALKNNLNLQGEFQNIQYAQALKNTAKAVDPAVLETEYGQFNSIYKDTRFSASQNFALPMVYKRKMNQMETNVKLAQNQSKFLEKELVREVCLRYFEYLSFKEKAQLYQSADSLYQSMLDAANAKLNAGESDILESEYIKMQKLTAAQSLLQTQNQAEIALNTFNLLLHATADCVPDGNADINLQIPQAADTSFMASHPAMQLALLNLEKTKNDQAYIQSRKLPGLTVGYNNFSIQGTGGDNRNYTSAYRFQSVTLALTIPIFNNGNKPVLQALAFEQKKDELMLTQKSNELHNNWENKWKQFDADRTTLDLYENTGLKMAKTLKSTALEQYKSGEIDYISFAAIVNQSINIEAACTDARLNFQQSLTEIYTLAKP